MFQTTEKAVSMIKEFLKDRNEGNLIRVMMMEGGCAGPSLGMVLDEQKDDDEVFNEDGLTFVINKELFDLAKPVVVDYVAVGARASFVITSNLKSSSACGRSCGC